MQYGRGYNKQVNNQKTGDFKMGGGRIKAFGNYHPIVLFTYFVSVIVTVMFSVNPVIAGCALIGGVSFCAVLQKGRVFLQSMAFYLPLLLIIALTNPLFSHNGATELFFLNGRAVTLESILYGINMAVMLVAVIYWCKCYNEIVTSDKFLYLFGRIIPKLSLVLSMAIRFIPLFKAQMKKISRAQKAMGLYSSDRFGDRLRSGIRVFSALVTWSLENAAETGNSMRARGYGLKGRSSYSVFRFRKGDGILIGVSLALLAAVFIGTGLGKTDFDFYPETTKIPCSPVAIITYISFGILAFLPFFLEVKEEFKWKYYISKI